MGAGASAEAATAAHEASMEELSTAFRSLSDTSRAKVEAALGNPADGEKVERTADAPAEADIEVTVGALNGESLAVLRLPASCAVGALKQKIAEVASHVVVEKQRLICGDTILADEVILKDLQQHGSGKVQVLVVLQDPLELKSVPGDDGSSDNLRVLLTEIADGVGKFESFGFEVFSFAAKRQHGTYELRALTDEERAAEDNAWTHSMMLRFSKELKRKKFRLKVEDVPVNLEKRTFEFFGEEE